MTHKKLLVDGSLYHVANAKGEAYCGASWRVVSYSTDYQIKNLRRQRLICEACESAVMVAGMRSDGQPELF